MRAMLSRSVFEDGIRDALMDSYYPADYMPREETGAEYRAGYLTGQEIELTAQMPPPAAGWEERDREAWLIARNAMRCAHCLDRIVDWRDRVTLDGWKPLHEDCRESMLAERLQENADMAREMREDARAEMMADPYAVRTHNYEVDDNE
jgi:hypothetical protein